MRISNRLCKLPKYLFAEIEQTKREILAKGIDLIDLSIGDPDLPTPQPIIDALYEGVKNPSNHKYPSYYGMIEFRKSVSEWIERRFGLYFDPKDQIITLIGSKEGIAHIHWAFLEEGDISLVPDPGYPVYYSASVLAGGTPFKIPLTKENNFFPDFEKIPTEILNKAKIMFINYPNNPTSANARYEDLEKAVWFANNYNIILCSDLAYSEIYEREKPISIFNIPKAKDIAIEFHSLSKTFSMTGWRIGFAIGKKELIKALGDVKSNIDSGVFNAIQIAGIRALQKDMEQFVENMRNIISVRKKQMVSMLEDIGFEVFKSNTTFYIWVKNPDGYTSSEISKKLLLEAGVVVTPGNGFGEYGEGFFRISLTAPDERIQEAVKRIKNLSL